MTPPALRATSPPNLGRQERMTADFLLNLSQAIINGLLTGMVYGLMALGLSVIFGVMRIVNFAHGEMMVVGMYLAWMGFEYLEVSPMLSLPVIAALFFAGADSRGVQMDSQFDSYELGPLVFDAVRLHAALAAVAIALLLWLFFTRTRTGKSIRAAADNN